MGKVNQEMSISRIYTANAKLKETNYFEWTDPFAIVVELSVDSARAGAAYPIDFLLQIVNPRTDPSDIGPWIGKDGKPRYTLDFTYDSRSLDAQDTGLVWKKKTKFWRRWDSYEDAMSGVVNGAQGGVFAIQATARFQFFHSFSFHGPAKYAYHFPGYTAPADPAPPPKRSPEDIANNVKRSGTSGLNPKTSKKNKPKRTR